MNGEVLLNTALLVAAALALYAALVWLSGRYSRATQWQPPSGTEAMDWNRRRILAWLLGACAVTACALASLAWLPAWSVRLLVIGQAAVMAAAGASDLRHFHLPLPLTALGIGLAVVTLLSQPLPLVALIFGLLWACVVILMHALLSKGSMQLGDHLATVWIALASPFNGLLAIVAGDFANVIVARVQGLRGKKVAAAGAWLVCAAALLSLPPYMALLNGSARMNAIQTVSGQKTNTAPVMPADKASALLTIARIASDHTARVAFAAHHDARVIAAHDASIHAANLARTAQQIAPDVELASILDDLAQALATYDVAAVRAASQRLADARQELAQAAAMRISPIEQ
jgi:hypothetical protein